MTASRFKGVVFALASPVLFSVSASAQVPNQPAPPKVFCEPQRALEVVKEQAAEGRLLEAVPARVAVLVRAADLLWPHDVERARALFAEAFDAASHHFREKSYEERREKGRQDTKMSGLSVSLPDQRFVVLRAIARRDAAWARKLTEALAEEARREAETAAGKTPAVASNRSVGNDILTLAESMLESDVQTAVALARRSLRGPIPWNTADFLYRLAERDRAAADALFAEALGVYAGRDINALVYLSPYPFGFNYTLAPPAGTHGFNRKPASFAPSTQLQRQFLIAFLSTAEIRLRAMAEQPDALSEGERAWMSEAGRIHTALLVLQSAMGARLDPETSARLSAATTQALGFMPAQMRARAVTESQRQLSADTTPRGADSFERAFEQAMQSKDPERRDMMVAMAIIAAPESVSLSRIEEALRAIEDAETRRQLSNWVFFTYSQRAAKEGTLDEATRLAERVEALDERALLLLEIAAEGIKRFDDRQRASELLEAVARAALKSPETVARARAQLGVAHLFASFDYPRASEVLAEAVKTINRLDSPDLSQATLIRKIEGKNFSTFRSNPIPGFNLEKTFDELGAFSFENTLALARDLEDRHLRSTAALAVAARCLEDRKKAKGKTVTGDK